MVPVLVVPLLIQLPNAPGKAAEGGLSVGTAAIPVGDLHGVPGFSRPGPSHGEIEAVN